MLAAGEERIASVRLDLPAEEAARLGRYVDLKAGQTLDPAAVRHTVELLFATGEFADVVVEKTAAPDGAHLLLRPVRAPLLREVVVQGDRVLAPQEARRLARLVPGEPLWPGRLARAAADLAAALRERGYLQASVEGEAGRTPRGAAGVFTVRAGARARVRSVAFAGADAGLTGPLRARARPRPGEVYERRRAEAAAEAMRKELSHGGRWRAAVTFRPEVQGTAVDLVFEVAAGAPVRVAFLGAEVPRGVRSSALELLRDGHLESDVVDEAADRLEEALRRRGHRRSSVRVERATSPGTEVVAFRLDAGPRARVASVRVEGLPVALPALQTRAGDQLQEPLLEEDQKRLAQTLEDDGYGQAQVEAEVPEGGGDLPVVFRVTPGPRTVVEAVTVESPEPMPEAAARDVRLRKGAPYRARDLAADRERLLASLRDAGHLEAEVTPEATFSGDRGQVSVVLRARPGPRVVVDHVVVAGLSQTREEVVRRELLLGEGQPLGDARLLESQQRLAALGLFSRVSLSEMDPESLPRRTVVVQATEAPLTTVAYGIGYAERDALRGSVEVTRRNLFGLDRSVTAFARASFRGSRFLATFREPWFLDRRRELFVTAFREDEDRDEFDFVRTGLLVQTARVRRPGLSLIYRYTYQLTDTFNVVDPDEVDRQFEDSTLSGPSASVVHDTRDDPFDPNRGHFLSADAQLSLSALGGDSFGKGFLQATRYQRLRPGAVLAVGARVGLARTFGLDEDVLLPRPDRFYAGGDYSLRGFPVDGVLPDGGNGLLLGGAELRLDLGRRFSTAVFLDLGNVFPRVGDMDLGNLRYAAGLGLRYRTALGPLRVDWGYKLDRQQDESPYHVHFTVGHAF